ncbi:aminoacetone oxidase family FAD-binding enzyme, partial [Enterobacter cloacae]
MEMVDDVVIGARTGGMIGAAMARKGGCRLLLLDNGNKPVGKFLLSGGVGFNISYLDVEPAAYLSQIRHFCKSALARYT